MYGNHSVHLRNAGGVHCNANSDEACRGNSSIGKINACSAGGVAVQRKEFWPTQSGNGIGIHLRVNRQRRISWQRAGCSGVGRNIGPAKRGKSAVCDRVRNGKPSGAIDTQVDRSAFFKHPARNTAGVGNVSAHGIAIDNEIHAERVRCIINDRFFKCDHQFAASADRHNLRRHESGTERSHCAGFHSNARESCGRSKRACRILVRAARAASRGVANNGGCATRRIGNGCHAGNRYADTRRDHARVHAIHGMCRGEFHTGLAQPRLRP
ncbi:MAG: hypothetical protein CK544_06645 [Planctomycetaceae bacterium]|nr:MAG: hypothetical protein CK544_06645 [Planctomycetaceae bacterium]